MQEEIIEKVENGAEKSKITRVAVELDEEKLIKFKIKAIENKRNMADILREFIDKYLES